MRVTRKIFTPEQELLLCCTRTEADAESQERVRELLSGEIDWAQSIKQARRHGVMPLLYRCLNARWRNAVPHSVIEKLRKDFDFNAKRNLMLIGELFGILDLFSALDIPVIVLKGPAMAQALYGDLSLRQFADIDILIPKKQVQRAKEVLLSRGYQQQFTLNTAQENSFLSSGNEYLFQREEGIFLLEIHWDVVSRYFPVPLVADHLWERAHSISLCGRDILVLSPEDMFLAHCIHGTTHTWERLGWIGDMAEMLRKYDDLDWKRLFQRAQELRVRRAFLLCLSLAKELLDAEIPQCLLREMDDDKTIGDLTLRISQKLFQNSDGEAGVLTRALTHLRIRDHWADRIFHLLSLIFKPQPTDWETRPLPEGLFPLYFFIRPIRLSVVYGRRLLARISFR
jgi:hypothetical protein